MLAPLAVVIAPVGWADLVVENTAGELMTTWSAGETAAIDPRFVDIRIKNTGAVEVEGVTATTEGVAAGDFSIVDLSATTIPAASSVTARIRFAPQALGSRQALLRIASTIPTAQESTVTLSGTGSTTFSPIIDDPSGTQSLAAGPPGQVYTFGTMTLNFLPTDQLISFNVTGVSFNNAPLGGIVYGSYQGLLYPYRAAYQLGPPPARTPTMTLSLALGTAIADFDAKLNGGGGSVAIQGDGKLIVTGTFNAVDGHPSQRIVRLNPDGTVDPSFHCSLDGNAESIAIDPAGRILICGYFNTVNGVPMPRIARLNIDGSLDSSFMPDPGMNHGLRVVSLSDGKVLVNGGWLRRLNADGSADVGFNVTPVTTPFNSFAVQQDGKIVANTDQVRRYHSDGTLDATFAADVESVTAIAVQPDGKVIVGGHFDEVSGVQRKRVARLNADGTLDLGFAGHVFLRDEAVSCVAVEEGGGVIISGTFTSVDGVSLPGVARLNSDGTLDRGFAPAGGTSDITITGMSLAADGSVFVAGNFSAIGSENRRGIAKLRNRPSVAEFSIEGGNTLRWKRSGSAPALSSVTFSYSTDSGHSWTVAGSPVRSGDSWVLGPVSLPAQSFLRASGGSVLSSRGFGLIQETKLHGRPLTNRETMRETQFGSPLSEGVSADGYDYDKDGHSNLIEYAFALNPKLPDAHLLPAWQETADSYEMTFPKDLTIDGISYHPEWSETMRTDDWHPGETLSDPNNNIFRIPFGIEERKFFRVRVTSP
jgi:uncharacterized delta-60 repeat protein